METTKLTTEEIKYLEKIKEPVNKRIDLLLTEINNEDQKDLKVLSHIKLMSWFDGYFECVCDFTEESGLYETEGFYKALDKFYYDYSTYLENYDQMERPI